MRASDAASYDDWRTSTPTTSSSAAAALAPQSASARSDGAGPPPRRAPASCRGCRGCRGGGVAAVAVVELALTQRVRASSRAPPWRQAAPALRQTRSRRESAVPLLPQMPSPRESESESESEHGLAGVCLVETASLSSLNALSDALPERSLSDALTSSSCACV